MEHKTGQSFRKKMWFEENLGTDDIPNHILRQNQIIVVASYIDIYTSVVKLLERRLVLCSSTL
jgi:hypothetical protein